VPPALGLGNARLRNQEGRVTRSLMPFATLEAYTEASAASRVGLTQFLLPAADAARGLGRAADDGDHERAAVS
jgi:hypothetical protein